MKIEGILKNECINRSNNDKNFDEIKEKKVVLNQFTQTDKEIKQKGQTQNYSQQNSQKNESQIKIETKNKKN